MGVLACISLGITTAVEKVIKSGEIVLGRFLILAVAATVSACTSLNARLDSPDPEQVIDYVKAFEKHFGRRIETGEDYVRAGYAYVEHYCEHFFVELEMEKRRLLFAKSSVAQAFTAAPLLVKAAHDRSTDITKPLAVIAALAGMTSSLFEQYERQFIFAPYGTQLRAKVLEAQDEHKRKLDSKISELGELRDTSAATVFKAHQVVQQYARLCTIPQLDLFIVSALDKTKAAGSTETPPGGQKVALVADTDEVAIIGGEKKRKAKKAKKGRTSQGPTESLSLPPFVSQPR